MKKVLCVVICLMACASNAQKWSQQTMQRVVENYQTTISPLAMEKTDNSYIISSDDIAVCVDFDGNVRAIVIGESCWIDSPENIVVFDDEIIQTGGRDVEKVKKKIVQKLLVLKKKI